MDPSSLTIDEILAHHGVKGMRWGIRKDDTGSTDFHSLVIAGPRIDATLDPATKRASKQVAALLGQRYGFNISSVKAIDSATLNANPGLMGYVRNTPGHSSGDIFASKADLTKPLKDAEGIGWFGENCGNVQGFLTHESAHAIFHAEQRVKSGFLGPKIVGGNVQAREKAMSAAVKQAKRDGIPPSLFTSKVSGYAAASGMREEVEAELFAQYHWSPNPPPFVKTWGQTLHQEMGVDPTPFREAVQRG